MDENPIKPVLAVSIWWSGEHKTWIASAQTIEGVIGTGKTFTEAAKNLEAAIAAWEAQEAFQK